MSEEIVESLAYSAILLRAIQSCDDSYGTELYRTNVEKLRHAVLNQKDGPKLRDIVEEFYSGPWAAKITAEMNRWKKQNPYLKHKIHALQDEEERLRNDFMPLLADFIRQLLMDNGCIKNYYQGRQ